jgi:hypothetical protein
MVGELLVDYLRRMTFICWGSVCEHADSPVVRLCPFPCPCSCRRVVGCWRRLLVVERSLLSWRCWALGVGGFTFFKCSKALLQYIILFTFIGNFLLCTTTTRNK